jgi:hypothetical protein
MQKLRNCASLGGVTYICEFLCEFAPICKNDLTHLSVTEVGLIDEKTGGRKSRETVSLTKILSDLVGHFGCPLYLRHGKRDMETDILSAVTVRVPCPSRKISNHTENRYHTMMFIMFSYRYV